MNGSQEAEMERSKQRKEDELEIEEYTEEEKMEMADATSGFSNSGSRIGGSKDVSFEIMAAAMYQRMMRHFGVKNGKKSEKSKSGPKSTNSAAVSSRARRKSDGTGMKSLVYFLIGIVIVSYLIYKMISMQGEESAGESNGNMSSSDKERAKILSFKEGSMFNEVTYFGKTDMMVKVVSHMTRMVNMMRTLNLKDLERSIETTQRNFLFHGPPGTGKTHFMKKLVYLVDLNMKMLQMKDQIGSERFKQMEFNEKMIKAKEMKSLVRIVFVTPSILNDKYVGETEKNIRVMFNAAKNANYWVNIVFIDEIDAFFSKRNDNSQEYSIKAQTEFLNQIGGACDDLRGNVFLFGATNHFDKLDPAFKRRFSTIYEFSPPNDDERLEILEQYLCDNTQGITDRYTDLVKLTNGMPQSKIVDILKKVSFSNDGKINEVKWDDLRKEFEDADPNKKGSDGSKIDVNKSIRDYYFLEPRFEEPKKDHKENQPTKKSIHKIRNRSC
ncbi:AAA family ATPase [Ordospora colligata]|uniref:AAA family ATPase n=1 Tax=Ordospora colligata OC4 TaxID=1354746 RepID=A0A0B2UII1_9MICR|nr:AAA family ATPase [Ordospora colligata OC4]KHN68852.1 AAA family ATPase [Ordospora colligata OC4]TBU13886.1 AAA family ATPase [Ordospora colligata]TBU14075.1 AAA family ATPase [Ordospora colligata]TBU17744.1 AAA family ATPase [Ordospora colligata]